MSSTSDQQAQRTTEYEGHRTEEVPKRALVQPKVIDATIERDSKGTFYAAYRIRVGARVGDVVSRRYSDFRVLDRAIRSIEPPQRPDRKELPRLTTRKFGRGKSRPVIEKRIRKLGVYLKVSDIKCICTILESSQ